MTAYHVPGNAVFIPEAGRAGWETSSADAFWAFGARDALGYSPFSIEDLPEGDLLAATYDALASMASLILSHQGQDTMTGFRPPVAFDGTVDTAPQSVSLGGYRITTTFIDPWTPGDAQHPENHGGLLIHEGSGSFLVAGHGLTMTFDDPDSGDWVTGIETAEEGRFVDGQWKPGRTLNGDQTHQGRHIRLPPGEIGVQRFRLYRYR